MTRASLLGLDTFTENITFAEILDQFPILGISKLADTFPRNSNDNNINSQLPLHVGRDNISQSIHEIERD